MKTTETKRKKRENKEIRRVIKRGLILGEKSVSGMLNPDSRVGMLNPDSRVMLLTLKYVFHS